jgi:hypothetical protein
MRIPLDNLEEVVSLWPGTSAENNRRRSTFKHGQRVSSTISLRAVTFGKRDVHPGVSVSSHDIEPIGRGDTDICRLADKFLLLVNKTAIRLLTEVVDSWRIQSAHVRELVLTSLADTPMGEIPTPEYTEYKADLQIFLLGYYYQVFKNILDSSRLSINEGFGSWGWYDGNVFEQIVALVETQANTSEKGKETSKKLYRRHQIMKLAAYLLAGAESHQLSAIDYETIGIHAKLTITASVLFGSADTPEKLTKLCLLDIDPTAIPSNELGIIKSGVQSAPVVRDPISPPLDLNTPPTLTLNEKHDFTSHIEPAWGYDTTLCFVTYRHQGRLVHRVSPLEVERAVLQWSRKSGDGTPRSNPSIDISDFYKVISTHARSQSPSVQIFEGTLSEFYGVRGGSIVVPKCDPDNVDQRTDSPMWVHLVHAGGMNKARSCIVAMYKDLFSDEAWGWLEFDWESACAASTDLLVVGIDPKPQVFGTGTIIIL